MIPPHLTILGILIAPRPHFLIVTRYQTNPSYIITTVVHVDTILSDNNFTFIII